jgi:hypothetical protein
MLGAVVLLAGVWLLADCGRTPPPEFWTWSADDSTKVRAAVSTWEAKLMSDFADSLVSGPGGADTSDLITYIPDTTRKALRQTLRENKYKQRWFPKTFTRTFTVDSMVDSVWTTKDTTIEVRLREFLTGVATITTDSVARLRNPDTVIGGMHFQVFDTFFTYQFPSPESTNHETLLTVTVNATCDRELFLVPMAGDTLDKVHRTDWKVKRISGAGRYYCPDQAGAPFLGVMQFVTNGGRRDTFSLRPDTLHPGVQRLYCPDSLLTYTVGESIQVAMSPTALLGQLWWSPPDIVAFLHLGHQRRNLRIVPPYTTFAFTAADVGMKQVYIEIVMRDPLTQKSNDFLSCMWAIPMNVKAAP